MQTIWKRIEDWLNMHAPELTHLLQPGASEEDIQHTEALLNVVFPEDIKESYRLHNGNGGLYPDSHFLVKSHALLSLEEMVRYWHRLTNPATKDVPDNPDEYALGAEDYEEHAERDVEYEEPANWRAGLSPQQRFPVSPEGSPHDPHLIPFLRWFDEGILCFDTDPVHQTTGMIIEYVAQSGFSFYALNWRDLLSRFADDLEAGKYRLAHSDNHPFLRFNDLTQIPL